MTPPTLAAGPYPAYSGKSISPPAKILLSNSIGSIQDWINFEFITIKKCTYILGCQSQSKEFLLNNIYITTLTLETNKMCEQMDNFFNVHQCLYELYFGKYALNLRLYGQFQQSNHTILMLRSTQYVPCSSVSIDLMT